MFLRLYRLSFVIVGFIIWTDLLNRKCSAIDVLGTVFNGSLVDICQCLQNTFPYMIPSESIEMVSRNGILVSEISWVKLIEGWAYRSSFLDWSLFMSSSSVDLNQEIGWWKCQNYFFLYFYKYNGICMCHSRM